MPPLPRHCGLDFGTSNTTLAIAGGNASAQLVPLEGDRVTIPSTIFFDFDSDETLYGRAATAAYVGGGDGRMMRSLKSILGSSLADEAVRIKRRVIPFLDIIGGFVGELKQRAEARLGYELDHVVLGRPAHYVDDDPLADREAQDQMERAVRAQGFRWISFQYEPIAAALDYEQQVTREELGLIVDLGGGTSDFSIVRVSPERARAADREQDILATAGVHVGGTDFDRLLSLKKVMPALGYQTPTADGKRPLPSRPMSISPPGTGSTGSTRTGALARNSPHRARGPRPRPGCRYDLDRCASRRPPAGRCGGGRQDRADRTTSGRLAFDGEEESLATPITRPN